jgi:SAM-dependent methyltransferase
LNALHAFRHKWPACNLALCLKEESVIDFYDQLSPFYHLLYEDWEAGIAWQAERLNRIIRARWGERVESVLDVSCGIGTQSLGLARLGFQVTASDLSPEAIARAKKEAETRNLSIPFSVCDMREAFRHHGGGFDMVISCDNSVPHLLSDEEILRALQEIYDCLSPGGGCLLTIRAYDKEARGWGIVKPYGIREEGSKRYLIFQVWDFEGEQYALSMYFIEDDMQSGAAKTHVMRSRYYAVSPNYLLGLMEKAGFVEVRRLDDVFYQPVLVGTKKAEPV